jgi:hypothetical protein
LWDLSAAPDHGNRYRRLTRKSGSGIFFPNGLPGGHVDQIILEESRMLSRIKQYLFMATLIGIAYFILAHHFIFHGRDFWILKKDELTLEYTFFSIKDVSESAILEIQPLRSAGIGEILVEQDRLSENERYEIEKAFDDEQGQ